MKPPTNIRIPPNSGRKRAVRIDGAERKRARGGRRHLRKHDGGDHRRSLIPRNPAWRALLGFRAHVRPSRHQRRRRRRRPRRRSRRASRRARRHSARALGLVWRSAPGGVVALAAFTLVAAALPPFVAWVGKLIIDAVVAAHAAVPGRRARPRWTGRCGWSRWSSARWRRWPAASACSGWCASWSGCASASTSTSASSRRRRSCRCATSRTPSSTTS